MDASDDMTCGACADGGSDAHACNVACATMGCPLKVPMPPPRQAAPEAALPPRLRAVMQHVAVMGIPLTDDLPSFNPSALGRGPRLLPQECAHNAAVLGAKRPPAGQLVQPSDVPYELGAYELGRDCYAYLQPHGQWGYSNSGLVVGDGKESLMVDTFFDLTLTQRLMQGYDPVTSGAPIKTLVNTHVHADHIFGNQVVVDEAKKRGVPLDIVQTTTTRDEIAEMPENFPQMFNMMRTMPTDEATPPAIKFFQSCFRQFDWANVNVTPATTTFTGHKTLHVGSHRDPDTKVELFELGPAHTRGDLVCWVPHAKVLYSGDLLFIGGTPIVWSGPTSNWIKACDAMLDLQPELVVPGHGPLTNIQGIRDVKSYLEFITTEARKRFDAGMSVIEAAKSIDLGHFSTWSDVERIGVNVDTLYREWGRPTPLPEGVDMGMYHWSLMAECSKK